MKSYKIAHLSIVFTLVVIFSVAIMASIVMRHMELVSEQQHRYEQNEAEKEIAQAVVDIKAFLEKAAITINEWGETRQQFVNREFYNLWKETRVYDSGILPSEFDDISLFDKDGKRFSLKKTKGVMPERLTLKQRHIQKILQGNDDELFEYWVYVFPVTDADVTNEGENSTAIVGYAAVTFMLKNLLVGKGDFRFIDVNSISSKFANNAVFDFDKVSQAFEYKIKSDAFRKELLASTGKELTKVALVVCLIITLALLFIHRFLIRPLKLLSDEINRLGSSSATEDLGLSLTQQPIAELERVRVSFNEYQSKLNLLYQNLEINNKEFFRIAHEDSLTGAFNRRAFEDDWNDYNQYKRDEMYAILIFDCDNFKPINDSYGHSVGDAVLRNIAKELMRSIRSDEKLYRLGGDEFATVIKNASTQTTLELAEHCRKNILDSNFRRYGLSESISLSIGISFAKVGELAFSDVMKRADLAMYKAKRPGESSIVVYSEELATVESVISTNAVNAVFAAIQNPEKFVMRYQPIVKLPSLDIDYAEALVKIVHDGHVYMPDVIFPIVEARNLDVEFDIAIIKSIEKDLTSGRYPKGQGVSINLSAPSVINTLVIDLLLKIKIAHPETKLVVEITETALITQINRATKNIKQLRDSGFLIALDDFGSGYSSLRYLTSMPVDVIKFDITMTQLLESEDEEHRRMIEKIAELIIELGYSVVAEGVETQSMLDKVIKLGFSCSQGYFHGRPEELP